MTGSRVRRLPIRLARIIPNARRVIIDDAGHMPQWEKPDEFNRVVR